MLLEIHPQNPQERYIKQVVDCLKKGGVIIYPTDTIYGMGCDITQPQAIERIAQIKNIPLKKAQFTFICSDLSNISFYTKSLNNATFRTLKNTLPGPYTFILEASKTVPKLLKTKKDTVGIRVPDHPITQAIVKELGNPIISTSLPMHGDVEEYTDASVIYDDFNKLVDIVIDGGIGGIIPSTVIDFTSGGPEVIREGLGSIDPFI